MKKTAVIELLNSFEDEIDVHDFIQKLIFIDKLDKGLQDVVKGRVKDYKEVKSSYNAEFVARIQESRKQVKNGTTRIININDLWLHTTAFLLR